MEAKERIRQWRQAQNEQQRQEEAEHLRRKQLQEQQERDRLRARQEELKATVEEHRRQRQLSSRSIASDSTDGESFPRQHRSQSMRELKLRQQKEIEKVRRRRMESVNHKTAEEMARMERLDKIKAPIIKAVSAALERKPSSQLMEPTESKKLASVDDSIESNIGKIRRFFTPGNGIMHTRVLPHRYVIDFGCAQLTCLLTQANP